MEHTNSSVQWSGCNWIDAVLVVFIEVRKSLTREHTSNHHPHTNGNNPISTNINSETCNEKSQSITVRTMVACHQCITMFVIHVKGCTLKAGFHKQWSGSRSLNMRCRVMRSSENQTNMVRSRILTHIVRVRASRSGIINQSQCFILYLVIVLLFCSSASTWLQQFRFEWITINRVT